MKILIIVAIIFLVFISGCDSDFKKACIEGKCFKVEVVDTVELRRTGLMEYDNLASDEGMWFIFPEDGKHSIWMKNMKFPIDIIWVDNEYNIVDVKRDAQPCIDECEVYPPRKDARYVLEVNVNSGINVGDKVEVR